MRTSLPNLVDEEKGGDLRDVRGHLPLDAFGQAEESSRLPVSRIRSAHM